MKRAEGYFYFVDGNYTKQDIKVDGIVFSNAKDAFKYMKENYGDLVMVDYTHIKTYSKKSVEKLT